MFEMLDKNGIYLVYDRKSRSDVTLENYKKIDSLKQHEEFLKRRIKELGIHVKKWYKEVVSGDNIKDRPEIQKLLKEVESGNIDGVLVVDIDRLARGDTTDQGIISRTFKYTNTKIITLNKVYDPKNDEDEDFFEFNLFFARREYKMINKRQQRGRLSSVMAGKFCASEAPYGYKKVKIKGDKGFTLEINEEEANVIRIIFKKRTSGVGLTTICNYLNDLNIKPKKSDVWTQSTLLTILSNPVYCGKIRWNMNKTIKRIHDGDIVKKRVKSNNDVIIVEGLHKGIVDEETFKLVQKSTTNIPRIANAELKNPFAGIVRCSICGRVMVRRPYSSSNNVRAENNLNRDNLRFFLREYKGSHSLNEIARNLNISKFIVDRWFSNKLDSFVVPPFDQYIKLKLFLGINDDSFDEDIRLYHSRTKTPHKDTLMCPKAHCKTVASDLILVENRIVELTKMHFQERELLLKNYIPKIDNINQNEVDVLEKEISSFKNQLDKAYDLVEKGIYSSEEFVDRTKKLKHKIESSKKRLDKIKSKASIDDIKPMMAIAKKVIEKYDNITSVDNKNELLKSIIDYVEYSKFKRGKDNFILNIHFKF